MNSKNRFKFIFLICLTVFVFGNDKNLLKTGEKLTYEAFFNYIPAGTATLSVVGTETFNNRPVSHIQYKVKTGKMADKLFKVRDEINVWLDTESYNTYKVKKSIREGNYRQRSISEFYYEDSLAVCNEDTLKLNTPIKDPYSLLYYFRSLTLKTEQLLSFTTVDNKTLSTFQVKVVGKEEISTKLGKRSCFILKPFREGRSLFKNQGDMIVWLSDDPQRLPVQIQVKMKFGSMLLKLKSVTNN